INNLEGSTALDGKLFPNPGVVAAFQNCPAGVTLAAGDERMVRVSYDLGAGFVAMTPNVPISSAPFAMVADTLQGKAPTDLIQVHNDATNSLNQANAEYIFSNLNFPKLKSIVDGNSTEYISPATGMNSQRLINVADPTAATDAATKNYTDTMVAGKGIDVSGIGAGVGGGKTLMWDQVQNKWVTTV